MTLKDDTNKNNKSVFKKFKTQNSLAGGDPKEDNIHGRDPLGQTFSSN